MHGTINKKIEKIINYLSAFSDLIFIDFHFGPNVYFSTLLSNTLIYLYNSLNVRNKFIHIKQAIYRSVYFSFKTFRPSFYSFTLNVSL